MVQFFESNTSRSDAYRLIDVKFEVLPEDFARKVKDPQLVAVGRSRVTVNSFDYKDFSSNNDIFQ